MATTRCSLPCAHHSSVCVLRASQAHAVKAPSPLNQSSTIKFFFIFPSNPVSFSPPSLDLGFSSYTLAPPSQPCCCFSSIPILGQKDNPLTLRRIRLAQKATVQFRSYRSAAAFGAITDEQFFTQPSMSSLSDRVHVEEGSHCSW